MHDFGTFALFGNASEPNLGLFLLQSLKQKNNWIVWYTCSIVHEIELCTDRHISANQATLASSQVLFYCL